jgi:hypothetical protein
MAEETLEQREAFDYYYLQGSKRGYRDTAAHCGKSLTTIKKWGKRFDWPGRVQQRDAKLARKIEKKTDQKVVDIKANYRRFIQGAMKSVTKEIWLDADGNEVPAGTVGAVRVRVVDEKKLKVESVKDFIDLVKLDLQLSGEGEKLDITVGGIQFIKVREQHRLDDDEEEAAADQAAGKPNQ